MAIKIGTIEQEEARCRRAFKGVEVGALVAFCHHAIPFEHLTEPWENRVNYILQKKPKGEQAVRLRWFRPMTKKQIAKMSPDQQKAYADYRKATAEWKKAYDHWQNAAAEWKKGCPWNGKDIFGNLPPASATHL